MNNKVEYVLPATWDLDNLPDDADPAYCEGMNIGILMCLINLKLAGLDVDIAQGTRQTRKGWWDIN